MEALQEYVPVLLFNMLCKAVLTFDSVNRILSSGAVYYAEL